MMGVTHSSTLKDDGTGLLTAIKDVVFNNAIIRSYFVLGHAILFFGAAGNETKTSLSLRLDIANALPRHIFEFKSQPVIQTITKSYQITLAVILGFVGLIELGMLGFIIFYRKETVMRIAQYKFLALLVLCALLSTLSCGFLMPTKDIYCNLWSPFCMIPLSMIGSILVGRLWRIHSVLQVTMRISSRHIPQSNRSLSLIQGRLMTVLSNLADWDRCIPSFCWRRRRNIARRRSLAEQTLRKQVKERHVLQLIFVLTLPQVLVQIISLVLYPAAVEIQLNESATIGRVTCQAEQWWPTAVGLVLVALNYVLAVSVSCICKDLPSLFNEKSSILTSAWISFIVVCVGGVILTLTDMKTTSPNTTAFLWTVTTLTMVLMTTWLIIVPKVRRVRSGQKLIISQLFNPSGDSELLAESSTDATQKRCSLASRTAPMMEDSFNSAQMQPQVGSRLELFPVVIGRNEPPPRRLELQMLALLDLLQRINNTSSEGEQISRQDWRLLHRSAGTLNSELDQVEFDWDDDNSEDANGANESTERLPREILTDVDA